MKASRTALGSAWFRAMHLRVDPPPWIIEDHLAEALLTEQDMDELAAPLHGWDERVVTGFRLSQAIRARVAEDVAVRGLAHGRGDYAILGAGADTFAWRHPRANEFTVWEFDTPATQAWKRDALARAELDGRTDVRFVPVDLETVQLHDVERPTGATWNWLGVTSYLSREATAVTLGAIAGSGAGTTLVVNFLLPDDECDDLGRLTRASATTVVRAAGEPTIATYGLGEVERLLQETGFARVDLLEPPELARRYLRDRTDVQLPRSTVIAVATA